MSVPIQERTATRLLTDVSGRPHTVCGLGREHLPVQRSPRPPSAPPGCSHQDLIRRLRRPAAANYPSSIGAGSIDAQTDWTGTHSAGEPGSSSGGGAGS